MPNPSKKILPHILLFLLVGYMFYTLHKYIDFSDGQSFATIRALFEELQHL